MERVKRFIMNREGIGFFKAVLESYEDAGIFSVLDGKTGVIEIIYPADFEKDIESIMKDMGRYGIEFREVRECTTV